MLSGHSDRPEYFRVLAENAGLKSELERLREIERVFNEGYLPPLPGEGPSLGLRALHRLRELVPEEGQ